MADVIAAMLEGDDLAVGEFLVRQQAGQVPALLESLSLIKRSGFDALTRDFKTFMEFKSPDPPFVIPRGLFEELLTLALSRDVKPLRDRLFGLDLPLLSAILSLCEHFAFADTYGRRSLSGGVLDVVAIR